MDNFDLAKALLSRRQASDGAVQTVSTTKTIMGTAVTDSADGYVDVNFGGESINYGDEQAVRVATTVSVKAGDTVIVTLIGADGTAKNPFVSGVVAGGDRMEGQITTMQTSVQQNSDSITALISAVVSGTADGAVVSSTMIRAYSGGVLVGKVGQSPCCLINADDSSFDIVEVTWAGDVPTVTDTLASFDATSLSLGNNAASAVIYLLNKLGIISFDSNTGLLEILTNPDYSASGIRLNAENQINPTDDANFQLLIGAWTQYITDVSIALLRAMYTTIIGENTLVLQAENYVFTNGGNQYYLDRPISALLKSLKITAPDYSNAQSVHTASNVTSGSYTVQTDGWLSVHFSQNAGSSNQQSYLVNVNNAAVCRQVYPKPSTSTWANYIPEPIIVSAGDVITYSCALGTNIEILHIPFFTT